MLNSCSVRFGLPTLPSTHNFFQRFVSEKHSSEKSMGDASFNLGTYQKGVHIFESPGWVWYQNAFSIMTYSVIIYQLFSKVFDGWYEDVLMFQVDEHVERGNCQLHQPDVVRWRREGCGHRLPLPGGGGGSSAARPHHSLLLDCVPQPERQPHRHRCPQSWQEVHCSQIKY